MEVYSETQIIEKLKDMNDWSYQDGALQKQFKFRDFKQALGWIVQVGLFAEQADHHPEILNVYNRVQIRLNTHSAKGITEKDFDLAQKIEKL